MIRRVRVAVGPRSEFDRRAELLRSLGRALSIEFLAADESSEIENLIWFSDEAPFESSESSIVPRAAALVLAPSRSASAEPSRVACAFTHDPALDPVLREQAFRDFFSGSSGLVRRVGDVVLAALGDQALWLRRSRGTRFPIGSAIDGEVGSFGGDSPTDSESRIGAERIEDWVAYPSNTRVLLNPPVTDLRAGHFFPWIPVLHWLRERCGDRAWRRNGIRAALLFDDPNLHAPTYGWMSFSKLSDLVRRERAHCSIATIPLDSWRSDARAARYFQGQGAPLSLSIHGNDHTYCEMERAPSDEHRRTMMKQALRRIEGLERRAQVTVDRVVIPPHSRFDLEMRRVMWHFPFRAICCGGRAAHSAETSDPAIAWLGPGESAPGRSPLLDRVPIMDPRDSLVWRAFLGYPLIVYGHHGDLAKGEGLVSEVCRWIHSLGQVWWLRLADLTRTNFLSRIDGDTFEVRAFSHEIAFDVPQGVRKVRFAVGFGESLENVSCFANGSSTAVESDHAMIVLAGEPAAIDIGVRSLQPIDPWSGPRLSPSWRAIFRRALTEGRDRVLPSVSRLSAPKD